MRLPRLRAALLGLALAALALPRPAHAWNRAGHMLTGVMAYRDLVARDPQAAARAVALLRQHPDYARWKPLIDASGRPEEEMLFAMAARWPDDVRGDANFHRSSWHYVNLPLVSPRDSVTPPATVSGDLLAVFPRVTAALRDDGTPDPQKAIALCWLLHLTGDIHQPLHAVALFDADHPEGDRGGNRFWIRPGVVDRPLNLHSFWDDVVLADNEADAKSVTRAAERLARAFPRDTFAAQLAVRDAARWAREESLPLARAEAYRDFTMPGVADTTRRVPVVPGGYRRRAREVAERQVALASYRISAALSEAMQ